jgi:hypothetical protein
MKAHCLIVVCGLSAGIAHGQTSATFSSIIDPVSGGVAVSANDMSPDGRWVVGGIDFNGDYFSDAAYRWDRQTNVFTIIEVDNVIPGVDPVVAVSDDGSVLLGSLPGILEPFEEEAAIWTDADGWTRLGFLPNAGACPSRSNGYELSGDGTVAVGLSWDGCSGRGFIWTAADGMQQLENMGFGGNRASIVSGDGSLIAGFAQGSTRTPTMWDGITRQGTLLDPSLQTGGEFHGMRDDGSVLLGSWDQGSGTFEAGMLVNGVASKIGNGAILPGWTGIPMDIADNGTIVGFDFLLGSRRAWVQPQGNGNLQLAKTYFNALGANIGSSVSLQVLQAISTDGTTIIGHTSGFGAFLVTLEYGTDCPPDLDNNGTLNFFDVSAYLALFNSQDPAADLDDNGLFNFFDVAGYIATFNAGCP